MFSLFGLRKNEECLTFLKFIWSVIRKCMYGIVLTVDDNTFWLPIKYSSKTFLNLKTMRRLSYTNTAEKSCSIYFIETNQLVLPSLENPLRCFQILIYILFVRTWLYVRVRVYLVNILFLL